MPTALTATLAAGGLGEDAEMTIVLSTAVAVDSVAVQVAYDPSAAALVSATAVPGSPFSSVAASASMVPGGDVEVSLTATGTAAAEAGVAKVVLRRIAPGSVSVTSLTAGLDAACLGCTW